MEVLSEIRFMTLRGEYRIDDMLPPPTGCPRRAGCCVSLISKMHNTRVVFGNFGVATWMLGAKVLVEGEAQMKATTPLPPPKMNFVRRDLKGAAASKLNGGSGVRIK